MAQVKKLESASDEICRARDLFCHAALNTFERSFCRHGVRMDLDYDIVMNFCQFTIEGYLLKHLEESRVSSSLVEFYTLLMDLDGNKLSVIGKNIMDSLLDEFANNYLKSYKDKINLDD